MLWRIRGNSDWHAKAVRRPLLVVSFLFLFLWNIAPADAQSWWNRTPPRSSKHYLVKTDLTPEDAKILTQHMDATFETYMNLFSRFPIKLRRPTSLDLYLFADRNDYHETLADKFGINDAGSWGMCIPARGKLYLVGFQGDKTAEEMKTLLQHEGFHQVSRHFFEDMPIWADEGLAEVFDRGIVVGNQLALGDMPDWDKERLVKAIKTKRVHSLDHLFNIHHREWSSDVITGDADANYLQAWSVCHFFLYADNGKYQEAFLNFLVQLNRVEYWEEAFETAFGTPKYRAMENKWREYVLAAPVTDYKETVRRLDFLAAGMRELRGRGIYPQTLAQLKKEMQKIRFRHELKMYDEETLHKASTAAQFRVPTGEGGEPDENRIFALVGNNGRLPKNYGTSKKAPQPLKIITVGTYPRRFEVIWRKKGNKYTYNIIAEAESTKPRITRASLATFAKTAEVIRRDPNGKATPTATDKTAAREEAARNWKSADGRFSIKAVLVKFADGIVHLKKADGKTIKVPHDKLSSPDQAYLSDWKQRN